MEDNTDHQGTAETPAPGQSNPEATGEVFSTLVSVKDTIFSECLAHENHPNFLKSLGHRTRPRVIIILSNGLESNS